MNIIKKNSLLQVIYIGLFFIFLYSCDGGKKSNSTQKKNNMTISDSRLQIGEVLTPLGCLIYGPWQPMNTNYGYNGAIYFENKEISSELQLFTEVEKQLVFELQKDGSLKYWFKKDYERHPTAEDSEYEKQGITRTTHFNPQVDHIKKIYTKGNWSVNFNDSTLNIHFDDIQLPSFNGRYSDLGSGQMDLQRISFFDSIYNGQKVRLKKVLTTYYEHPWNNW